MTGHVAAVFGSFFAGCVGSGLIIRHKELRSGYPYGIALMFECGLLVTACYLLRHESMDGAYFAAMACGLQNRMATTYSGAVIRTTHVTGIVTDLGLRWASWRGANKSTAAAWASTLFCLAPFFWARQAAPPDFGFLATMYCSSRHFSPAQRA